MPDNTVTVEISKTKLKEKLQAFKKRFNNGRFEDLSERQERLLQANIFMGKMLAVGALFHLFLYLYPDTTGIQESFAGLITATMNFFGYGFTHEGIYIMSEASGYRIVQDCLGWKSMMAFTALMIASGDIRNNLKYLGAGLVLISIANYVRVVTTIHLAEAGILSFEVIHSFLWTWSLTAIVLAVWMIWFHYFRDQ